jgi:hypothetical protein
MIGESDIVDDATPVKVVSSSSSSSSSTTTTTTSIEQPTMVFTLDTSSNIPEVNQNNPFDNNNENVDDNDNMGPQSSYENIVPVEKLMNGWSQLSQWVSLKATHLKEKAIEINNSEKVQQFKQKSSENVAWAVEKSKEMAEKSQLYVESAKETVFATVEKIKEKSGPTVEKIKVTVSDAAAATASAVSETYKKYAKKDEDSENKSNVMTL